MPIVMLDPKGSNVGLAGFIVDFSLVKSCRQMKDREGEGEGEGEGEREEEGGQKKTKKEGQALQQEGIKSRLRYLHIDRPLPNVMGFACLVDYDALGEEQVP
mmetsp:Transcript_39964/g.125539  ORF Transcript_39964/g.125539 Transcript_39964/m.125539 type:complete len:102 (+) Transcript_39964:163-468(+)